jgi:hypothetical protein
MRKTCLVYLTVFLALCAIAPVDSQTEISVNLLGTGTYSIAIEAPQEWPWGTVTPGTTMYFPADGTSSKKITVTGSDKYWDLFASDSLTTYPGYMKTGTTPIYHLGHPMTFYYRVEKSGTPNPWTQTDLTINRKLSVATHQKDEIYDVKYSQNFAIDEGAGTYSIVITYTLG